MSGTRPAAAPAPRYAAVDVHYLPDGGARGAAVLAADERFAGPPAELTALVDRVAPYRPGAFALRELPVLRAVLADAGPLALVVVDGYVDLDPSGRPGLGAHLHEALGVPVVGVAKTAFRGATHARPVLRGTATRPLLVTAAGIDPDAAARLVAAMAGPHRLPDALRRADSLARTSGEGGPGAGRRWGGGYTS